MIVEASRSAVLVRWLPSVIQEFMQQVPPTADNDRDVVRPLLMLLEK